MSGNRGKLRLLGTTGTRGLAYLVSKNRPEPGFEISERSDKTGGTLRADRPAVLGLGFKEERRGNGGWKGRGSGRRRSVRVTGRAGGRRQNAAMALA